MTPKSRKEGTRPQQISTCFLGAAALLACLYAIGCTSSNSPSSATCSNPGGAVAGPADNHCGSTVLTVDPNICATASDNASADTDAGAAEYGDTLYKNEGDDDDCKYHVVWSSTPICEHANVSFNLKVTAKNGGGPVTGATPVIEAFLTDTHPAQVAAQSPQETSAGNYTIGPVQFDTKGQWTVRFHLFPTGCDEPTSPHGHAAFFVNVP